MKLTVSPRMTQQIDGERQNENGKLGCRRKGPSAPQSHYQLRMDHCDTCGGKEADIRALSALKPQNTEAIESLQRLLCVTLTAQRVLALTEMVVVQNL